MLSARVAPFVEFVDSPLCSLDGDGRIVALNRGFADLLGIRAGQGRAQPIDHFLRADDALVLRQRLANAGSPPTAPGTASPPLVLRLRGGAAERTTVEIMPAGDGWLLAARALAGAGTGSRNAERLVRDDRSLHELTAIVDNAFIGILFSRNRVIERCNRRAAEIFGFGSPDELAGQPGSTVYLDAAAYERAGREVGPLLAAGQSYTGEWPMRRIDGSTVWCTVYARAVDPQHTDRGTVWIFDDISEARRTHETLQRTLHELDAIMSNASVGVLITRNRCMVRYNRQFADMFGFDGDSGFGQLARLLYRSDTEYAQVGAVAGPLLGTGRPFRQELWMQRQDGQQLWVNLIGYVENPHSPTEGTIWILEDRTAFRRAEDALRQAHDQQRLILDYSVVGIAFVQDRVFQHCNRRLEELYGYGPGDMAGQPTTLGALSPRVQVVALERADAVMARGQTWASEEIHRRRDGEPFWVRITGRAIDPTRPAAGSIWNYEDITDRKLAEESLRESEMLQRAILESANLMILATDRAGGIVTANPAVCLTLGWSADELVGRTPTELFIDPGSVDEQRRLIEDELGLACPDAMDVLVSHARLGRVDERTWRFRRRDGTTLPVQLSVSTLLHSRSQVKGYLLVAADITLRVKAERALQRSHEQLEARVRQRTAELEAEMSERRRAEQRLRYLAHHDSLTGLPNRALLRQRLDEALQAAAQRGLLVGVLFVDLDRFKTINDSLGHHAGDALLKVVAQRIAAELRAGDTVARLGGDEFVVVLPGLDRPGHAEHVAAKLRDALQAAVTVGSQELFATPSIGLCFFPHDGTTADHLLRNADTAMYAAKAAGRNTVRRFDAGMTEAAEQHFQIEGALRRAVQRREFEPYFQPWYHLGNGDLAGMEVLARWRHPERGLLAPARFIPIAEESGLIAPIGEQVLRAACEQLRYWDAAGTSVPLLAVNLSPWQFRDSRLLDLLRGILDDAGVDATRIELEITESALMQDGEHTLATLGRMKDAGFSLAVDDFGTGYSSLAYLKRFPVDELKIDRSFVIDMTHDPDDAAIVGTIIALARVLRLQVVAEGVETAAQRDALRAAGCDCAQGYLYAAPLPASQALGGVAQQRAASGRH